MFVSLFGKDIYWYGVQATSLLETGNLHSPDRSPVFHIVALVFHLFGINDQSLFVFQIITVLWLTITLYGTRFLLKSPTESWNLLPSAMVFVLGVLYPKQAWAIGFLLLSFGFSVSIQLTGKWWRWFFSGICFLFAIWFHTMVGVLGLGIWIVYRIPRKYDWVIFLLLVILPPLIPSTSNDRLVLDTKTFPIFAALAMVGMGILWDWFFLVFGNNVLEHYRSIRRALAFLGLLIVLPIFHFADIQFRILISLLLLVEIFSTFRLHQIWIIGFSFGLWILTFLQSPQLFRYPYEDMWNPGERAALFPNNGLLVAHHGFCEYYHFQFKKDCMSWEPDEKAITELSPGKQIYRLVYGIRMENLRASTENGNPIFSIIEPLGEYQLVLETDWQRYRMWLEKRNSKLLGVAKSWKNPYRKRPGFLQRKQQYGI
ncbi:hypothetical protein EHQ92_02155 [Leptospira biflexa]|uniref:hypothetical protein n=1 Tax=Leptospira biflexa TaxID=172 RepID=UPI0010912184|nr:hypothetical protein [Leptospira biflexa]TGM46750.1 hypothetical protein EHQ92_02155 [Leptospira biflexa]TGM50785.1 hypothetical protein EHQ88_10930 [Leptospira biflexa]